MKGATQLGRPQSAPYTEQWTPRRYNNEKGRRCYFCWEPIPTFKPGAKRGTRGTKAYYARDLDLWLCLACKDEQTRVKLASESAAPAPRDGA